MGGGTHGDEGRISRSFRLSTVEGGAGNDGCHDEGGCTRGEVLPLFLGQWPKVCPGLV